MTFVLWILMSVLRTYMYTVWKIEDFSDPCILREINFGEFRASKTVILTFLDVPTFSFVKLKFETLKNCLIFLNQNCQSL